MIERIWTSAKKQEQLAKHWLYRHLDNFLEYRRSQGYSLSSIANNAFHLIRYGEFLRAMGKAKLQEVPDGVDRYVPRITDAATQQQVRWAVRQFSLFLRKEALISNSKRSHPAPRFYRYVSAYEQQMREQRGLANSTIAGRRAFCIKFLKSVYDMGARKMVLLRPRHVQQFTTHESTQHCRITMIEHCSILRDFLAFLYQAGNTYTRVRSSG